MAKQPYRYNYERGDIMGHFTFLQRLDSPNRRPMGLFLCRCGKEHVARIQFVKSGELKSCGCITKQLVAEAGTKYPPVEYTAKGVKKMRQLPFAELKRFWNKISIPEDLNLCWNWTANGERYGAFRVGKVEYKSNRIAYFLHNNEDPEDFSVMHSCDNPKCCNPLHLSLGSHYDNMQDMAQKGRANPGGYKNKNKQ